MRAIAALFATASFSAIWRSPTLPPRTISASSIMRSLVRCSPARIWSRTGYSSSSVTLVRNPSPPRFTARIGTLWLPRAREAESSVPSPPSTISRSTCAASSSRERHAAVADADAAASLVSSSMQTVIFRLRSQSSSGGTTVERSSRFGLEMMPAARIISGCCILCHPRPARVQKKLLFPSGARHMAGARAIDFEPCRCSRLRDSVNRFLVQRRLADDAALAHIALFELELRFYQNNKISVRRCQSHDGHEYLADADERHIYGHELRRLVNILGFQVARVFLQRHHAGILAQFPIQLIDGHVDGENFARTILQQTIGKSAGRTAHIHADAVERAEREILERAFQFQPRPAGIP